MEGSMHISDLITNPAVILPGRINIIEANVSAGKTHFALNTLPTWTGSPERILYLIDTKNGEYRMLENILTVSRQTYAFCEYGKKRTWGEILHDADGKMPLMTYAGFGSEVRGGSLDFHWHDYDYIVCDEMQNLVKYQHLKKGSKVNLEAAEAALRTILMEGRTPRSSPSVRRPRRSGSASATSAAMSLSTAATSCGLRPSQASPTAAEWKTSSCGR